MGLEWQLGCNAVAQLTNVMRTTLCQTVSSIKRFLQVRNELDIKLLLACARPHIAPTPSAFPWNGKDWIFEGYVPSRPLASTPAISALLHTNLCNRLVSLIHWSNNVRPKQQTRLRGFLMEDDVVVFLLGIICGAISYCRNIETGVGKESVFWNTSYYCQNSGRKCGLAAALSPTLLGLPAKLFYA